MQVRQTPITACSACRCLPQFFFPLAVWALFLAALLVWPVNVIQAQDSPAARLEKAAPESTPLFFSWTGLLDFDPQRSPTEKWLAQAEIMNVFTKLKAAGLELLETTAVENPEPAGRALIDLMKVLLPSVLEQPGMIYLNSLGRPNADPFFLDAVLACELGDATEEVRDGFKKLLPLIPVEDGLEIGEQSIAGRTCWTMVVPGSPLNLIWTIDQQQLVVATKAEGLEQYFANQKTPVPAWLEQINRDYANMHLTSKNVVDGKFWNQYLSESLPPDQAEVAQVIKVLGFDTIEKVVAVTGVNAKGSIISGRLTLDGPAQGIFTLIGPPAQWEPQDLSAINPRSEQIVALAVNWSEVLPFLERLFASAGDTSGLPDFQQLRQETGVDAEAFLQALDPKVMAYYGLTIVDPAQGLVAAIKIKDQAAFDPQFAALMQFLEDRLGPDAGFSTKQRDGVTIYSATIPSFSPLNWAVADGQWVLAFNQRKLTQHLKRIKVDDDSNLARVPPISDLFDSKVTGIEGDLLGLSLNDYRPSIELSIPAIQALGQELPLPPEVDLSLDDIPSVETLTNGLDPAVVAYYRTQNGFAFYNQQTLPVISPTATGGVLVGLLLPAIQAAREAARRAQSQNNIRQLNLALLNFEATHSAYPAAYSVNDEGQKLLSWRVHILPYIEEQELYDQFHLDEPWDSPHNLKLAEQMPLVFQNPSVSAEPGKTGYLGVAGEHGIMRAPQDAAPKPLGSRLADVTDGMSNTISVVEVGADHVVTWTAPEDFDYNADNALEQLRSVRATGFGMGFADGSVQNFSVDTTIQDIAALFTSNQGDFLERDEF